MIERVAHWQCELLLWGARQRRMKWAWGETDCVALMCQGLEVVFGHPIMRIDYTSREEARACMHKMGTSASTSLERYGAVRYPVSELQGGDVIVRPGMANGMPRIALALDDEVLITSDPIQGPHWICTNNLRRRARLYRFAP
jgi:hypothetical protein